MGKNIWYISKYASPLKYGFATRHFYFAKEFNKHGFNTVVISSDSNHLVSFPVFKETYTDEVIDEVITRWIKTRKYTGAGSLRRIISWIDFEWKLLWMPKKSIPKPDYIIISSLSLLTILSGIMLKYRYNCRLIFEVRDIWPMTIIQIGGYNHLNPFVLFLSWVEWYGYKKADIIIGTMPNLSAHVYNIIGANQKCFNISQGVDISLYENRLSLPEGHPVNQIPKGKFIIGYAGSIGKSNALESFINCAIELKDYQVIHFVLIGEGDKLVEFKKRTIELNNITFLPKVKKQQVQTILSHFDLLYDSVKNIKLYEYGLSRNKWIDYMYAEKPIIASYSGYQSMLNEAECGTFVPAENTVALKEAILKYSLFEKDKLREIGQNGRKWLLQNRTFDKLALEYINYFDWSLE